LNISYKFGKIVIVQHKIRSIPSSIFIVKNFRRHKSPKDAVTYIQTSASLHIVEPVQSRYNIWWKNWIKPLPTGQPGFESISGIGIGSSKDENAVDMVAQHVTTAPPDPKSALRRFIYHAFEKRRISFKFKAY
jgi:hypothetical protein